MSWKIACTEGSHSTLQHDNSRCPDTCSTLNGGGDVCSGDGLCGEPVLCMLCHLYSYSCAGTLRSGMVCVSRVFGHVCVHVCMLLAGVAALSSLGNVLSNSDRHPRRLLLA